MSKVGAAEENLENAKQRGLLAGMVLTADDTKNQAAAALEDERGAEKNRTRMTDEGFIEIIEHLEEHDDSEDGKGQEAVRQHGKGMRIISSDDMRCSEPEDPLPRQSGRSASQDQSSARSGANAELAEYTRPAIEQPPLHSGGGRSSRFLMERRRQREGN